MGGALFYRAWQASALANCVAWLRTGLYCYNCGAPNINGESLLHRRFCLFVALFSLALGARAEIVADLYEGLVPVGDQGSRALGAASSEALAQVLVKVSGSASILENPEIAASLPDARQQVQQYSYVQPGSGQDSLQARIEFDSDYVTGLVISAGEPLWTANRPAVLTWLALEDERGRRLVTRESDPELQRQMRESFTRQGVPLQLPLNDLTDAREVSVDDVWQLSGPALQAGSRRYAVDHVVAARLTRLGDGRWLGDWAYMTGTDRYDRRLEGESADAFIALGVAELAQQMAARYAVLPTLSEQGSVPLVVTGVRRFEDYASLVNWLGRLELVDGVRLRRVSGERLELGLSARADAAQLATLIELNRYLAPALPTGPGQPLEYLWQK